MPYKHHAPHRDKIKKIKSRKLLQQKTEVAVSVRVINIMTGLGMPVSIKIE
jgi:hypothetical protein